jgi:hypothetical protein
MDTIKQGRPRLFPESISNEYRGTRVALLFFVLLTAVTVGRSIVHIVLPDGGAQTIATIPLGSFGAEAADVVVHLFALWGLSQLIIGVVYVVALIRYRSLIPLLYLLAIGEYLVRLILTLAKPIETTSTAPGAIGNYILVPLLALMLVLSLIQRREVADSNK